MKTIELFQWDLDKSIPAPYPEVHFASLGDDEALVVASKDGNANVPNILLQEPKDIMVWFVEDGAVADSGRIRLITRPKPTDYIYTETEIAQYEKLNGRIDDIEEQIKNIEVGSFELPVASNSTLGGIKVGQNLTISQDGTLNAPYSAKGEKGDKGDRGEQGIQGVAGANGKDGKTPIRGVDYWTESDKQEINSYIDSKIPSGDGSGDSYVLPAATKTSLGGIKVGANLSITDDGTLSAKVISGGDSGNTSNVDEWEQVYYQMATADAPMRIITVTKNQKGEPLSIYKKLLVTRESPNSTTNRNWYSNFRIQDADNKLLGTGQEISYINCSADRDMICTLFDDREIVESYDINNSDKNTNDSSNNIHYLKRELNYRIKSESLKEHPKPYSFNKVMVVMNASSLTDFLDAELYTKLHIWGVRK